MKFGLTIAALIVIASLLYQQLHLMKEVPKGRFEIIQETFLTENSRADNVDSLVPFHSTRSNNDYLVATAKEGNSLLIYSAADGKFVHRIQSQPNDSAGIFLRRPNGIALLDEALDIVAVVERDNHRVQLLQIVEDVNDQSETAMDLRVLKICAEDLIRPYGIAIHREQPRFNGSRAVYQMFVTDNYMDDSQTELSKSGKPKKVVPEYEKLHERIRQYRIEVSLNKDSKRESKYDIEVVPVRVFGDTQGNGVLHKVETIAVDSYHNRLLIADEDLRHKNVKIFDLNSAKFTGKTMGDGVFENEPEGIALYECANGEGYWVMTDQHYHKNQFHIFDRRRLSLIGTFAGKVTANTDGVGLTQRAYASFPKGAFFAVHADGSIAAFDWSVIAALFHLRTDCTITTPKA